MYLKLLFLLATICVLTSSKNVLQRYQFDCQLQLGTSFHPCQKACEFNKMGLTTNGKFDVDKATAMIDRPGGLGLQPDNTKILLKAAFRSCHREISPAKSLDKCSAASAMYYCVNGLLQPELLYREEEVEDSGQSISCRCPTVDGGPNGHRGYIESEN